MIGNSESADIVGAKGPRAFDDEGGDRGPSARGQLGRSPSPRRLGSEVHGPGTNLESIPARWRCSRECLEWARNAVADACRQAVLPR